MNCLKQLKAFKFFKYGHVQDIKFSGISVASNYCFVKAKILPSMHTDCIYALLLHSRVSSNMHFFIVLFNQ